MPLDRMSEYMSVSSSQRAVKRRYNDHIWLIAGTLVLLSMLIGTAYALLTLVPTEQIYERQAERCRARLNDVKAAVDDYVSDNGELPPDGRLNEDHALTVGGYIKPPKCPSTGNYYIIEYRNREVFIICDSKLEGHEI
ncbi:MAG: hypothetical protein JXA49_03040 [Actinobacteria bacterium]|nr:hypothetical protein [Actinomycetota bacterium]